MNKTTIYKLWGLTPVLAGVCIVLSGGCSKENAPATADGGKIPPLVGVQVAAKAAPAQTMILSGQIRARHETALGFRVAGKISKRNVDAGQSVSPGEVLYSLDDADYQLKVNAMRAQEAAAKAKFDNVSDELERHKVMLEKKLISQPQFDRVQTGYDQAKAALDAAVSARENAENDAGYTKLTVDHPAIVSEILCDAGQVVGAGTPVVMIAQTDDPEAEVYVPEKFVAQLKIGDTVEVRLDGAGLGNVQGVLREIAGSADPRTRTYRTRITLKNPPQGIRLGMSADVSLSVPLPAEGVLVPAASITDGDGGTHVWIVDDQNTAHKRDVTIIGAQDGEFVISDVREGEHVVLEGSRFLQSDQKVRTVTPEGN